MIAFDIRITGNPPRRLHNQTPFGWYILIIPPIMLQINKFNNLIGKFDNHIIEFDNYSLKFDK